MAQTLLQLVNQAQAELGIAVSSTVISNTARPVVQMLNLLNGVGQDLQRDYEWQALTKRYQFQIVFYEYTGNTTVDSTTLSTLSSTTGLTSSATSFLVSGSGIPTGTSLVSVDGGASTAVISNAATATASTVDLTFSQYLYDFPSDFDRLIDDTEWDRSDHWQLLGPSTAQQWEYLFSGWIATGPRATFRQLGNKFALWPAQSSDLYMGFEYVSNLWVAASASAALTKTAYAVDTDVATAFPDRLLLTGLKARFAMANQRPDAPVYEAQYMKLLSNAKASDAGSATLSMSGRRPSLLIDERNIPDSFPVS